MRGQNTFEILALLDEAKDMALDVLGASVLMQTENLLHGGYKTQKFLRERKKIRADKEEKRQAMRRFYAMVSYLEQDGLVRKEIESTSIMVCITQKGKRKLENLENTRSRQLPPCDYEREEKMLGEGTVTIVTFDIPEKKRSKRDWMRSALKNVGFTMIHRSVWMGENGIPQRFLEDMRDLGLTDFVEIFQISKAGSLRRLL